MLDEAEYGDRTLVKDIRSGFDLMGRLPVSNVFPKRHSHATMSAEQVRKTASVTRKAIWNSSRSMSDPEIQEGVYAATVEEKERGWLEGPLSFHELEVEASLTRRFGVAQSSTGSDGMPCVKIRPIDNFTESLINLTNSGSECIPVHSVDVVIAALNHRLVLGHLAEIEERLGLSVVDLRKAYKQLAVSSQALNDGYLCVYNPHTKSPEAYRSLVLPFGARAAVQGFYRASHSLWYIGCALLHLHWTLFFDDFLLVGRFEESKHLGLIVQAFFETLGWETAAEKGGAFESCAEALGVLIDLSDSCLAGRVMVRNTEKRTKELVASIRSLIERGRFKKGELLTLRGRLQFCEGQLFGRSSAHQLQLISSRSESEHGGVVDQELRETRYMNLLHGCFTGTSLSLYPVPFWLKILDFHLSNFAVILIGSF